MKAVCIVLCLMLARDIAGSIFRTQYDPRLANLVVQPLEFLREQTIDRFQRHQHQTRQNSRHRAASSESHSQENKNSAAFDDTSSDYLQSDKVPINAWNSALFSTVIGQPDDHEAYDAVNSWPGNQITEVSPNFVTNQKDYEKSSIFYDAFITMKHMSDEEKKRFHDAYQTALQASNEDVQLTASQLLKKHHYGVEEHTVKTDDGYLLTLFRIPAKQHQEQQSSEAKNAPVVFLMHGLLGSADDWLLMGPGKSLAYLLSDAGYDVWLGNARGNKYSRRHVSKHPAQSDFWQFTTDEIALHDLPAMIDYTLNATQQEKLVYVGHSLGTTAFFALASAKPEYNDKITMMHAMSPMVYMSNVRSPLLRMISANQKINGNLKDYLLGEDKFNPNNILIHLAGGNMCEYEIGCKDVCSNVNFVMAGVNPENVDVNLIPVIMSHSPDGASIRQMKQYGQAVASHEFRKYDYGADINEKIYGQEQPPKYDMTKVQAPVALYYSDKDWLAHPKDVDRLKNELPNVRDSYKVPDQEFTHTDFQFSKKAPEVVYKRLTENIQNYQE